MIEQVSKFVRFTRLPKIQLGIFLVVIAVSAISFGGQSSAVRSMVLAVGVAILVDYFLIRLRKIQPFFLSAAIVSGLIIGLLAFPPLPWYYVTLTGVLAMMSKNFLRLNSRHIFNPAAFGLMVAGIILRQNVSWWGVIFQSLRPNPGSILLFLTLLSPAYISIFRLRQGKTIFSFLAVYTLMQIILRFSIMNFVLILTGTLLSPLLLFFCLVMLPEPMTSPNDSRLQVFFGAFVAVVATMGSYVSYFFVPDTLLIGLLTGNLIFFKLRQKYP